MRAHKAALAKASELAKARAVERELTPGAPEPDAKTFWEQADNIVSAALKVMVVAFALSYLISEPSEVAPEHRILTEEVVSVEPEPIPAIELAEPVKVVIPEPIAVPEPKPMPVEPVSVPEIKEVNRVNKA